jgi:stearoyl-CoA desaturase (delta-9 desaturase)
MMKPVFRVNGKKASAEEGKPVVDLPKVAWNGGMTAAAILFCPFYFSIPSLLVFAVLTYSTLLVGHSAGMHRMMIHRTFKCPKWLERTLIYIGVLVGMAGPFGVLRIHDLRDWAQRQAACHDFFSHRKPYRQDLTWQLFYCFEFFKPPVFTIESELSADPFYVFLERTWRWHQLVIAAPLFMLGGFSWVVWGVFARVSASVIGHWTITYFCHNPGPGVWRVQGACVQASNLPGVGILTFGECWHNNHHAFPESARIGLEAGQSDPAWRFIDILRKTGLARDVGLPRPPEQRRDLYKAA